MAESSRTISTAIGCCASTKCRKWKCTSCRRRQLRPAWASRAWRPADRPSPTPYSPRRASATTCCRSPRPVPDAAPIMIGGRSGRRHQRRAAAEELRYLGYGQGSGKVIPLRIIAKMRAQELELPAGLHALGNNLELEGVRHADDRKGDCGVIRVGGEVANERSIDFDGVDRKPFQVGKAREAGSEVVDGKANSEQLQSLQDGNGLLRMRYQKALRQLEFEQRRIDAVGAYGIGRFNFELEQLRIDIALRGGPGGVRVDDLPRKLPAG